MQPAASKIPLFSTPSSKERFHRPFIKQLSTPHEGKENRETLTSKTVSKKQAVLQENPSRKLSLTSQDTLLSPGHAPNNKPLSFKSPQRPTSSFNYNVKNSGTFQQNGSVMNVQKNAGVGNNIGQSKPNKEGLLQKVKTFSSDLVESTKTFINFKLNRFSHREKCACDAGLSPKQTCETAYNWLFKRYTKKDLAYLQTVYENLQKDPIIEENLRAQIRRDLLRTFPNFDYFKEGHEGIKSMEKVLITFASYDPQIGYVQGMNYITAFFLYHSEEYVAFWLLASMFELFELRDVYLPNLPGLSKHLQIIDMLVLAHLPQIYNHFAMNMIRSEMYCSPWIFSLFGMVIPLEEMKVFYSEFLEKGWTFFYQIVLGFLRKESARLLAEDSMGILQLLTENNYKFLKPEDYKKTCEYWTVLIRSVSKESSSVNSQLISKLHSNFDSDTRTFKILLNSP